MPKKALKLLVPLLLGAAGFGFALLIGMWSKNLFVIAESVHFSVNFPTASGESAGEVMDCCDVGGPWSRVPPNEWDGYPAGGVLTWGEEGAVVIDLGKEGFLKRTFQPYYFNLSSHWLRNVGTKPYQIGLAMDLCGIELDWETHEAAWDNESKIFTRYVYPKQVLNMDWYFDIPEEVFHQSTICEGQLEVIDVETTETLTILPIKLINTRVQ